MAGESLGLSAAWIPPCAIMVLASPRRSLVVRSTVAPRWCANMAAEVPAPPPPMTRMSTSWSA